MRRKVIDKKKVPDSKPSRLVTPTTIRPVHDSSARIHTGVRSKNSTGANASTISTTNRNVYSKGDANAVQYIYSTYLSSNDSTYTQASVIGAWRINLDLKTISFLYLKTLFHPLRQIILRFHVRSLVFILIGSTNVL